MPPKKKTEVTEPSEPCEVNSTGSLVPVVTRDSDDAAPLMVMTQTREEMASKLKSLLSVVRESILTEVEVMQCGITEAALSEVADRLTELNQQLSHPRKPMTIVLLPALRRKAQTLEASLATLYQQAGLKTSEATAAAKSAVKELVPNCPA